MRNTRRLTMIGLLLLGVFALSTSSWAQARPPIVEKLAKNYGLDSFGQVEAIRYSFNLDIPGLFSLSRSWEWEPKTGKVTYQGKDKDGKPVKVTYMRSELASQPDSVKNEIEPGFVNDNYWLLLPFHIFWDTSATVTDEGMKKLPVGTGSAEKIVVKYPAELGGYTPGDTWDLYIGKDARTEAMVYHRGGPKKPSLVVASWQGYKKAGPLLFSTDHRGTADGKALKLVHSGVAVKLTGSDKWVDAK